MNMNPLSLSKTWVRVVDVRLSSPQCVFNQFIEIDMPYNDFASFSEEQQRFIVEAELSKLGYVLDNGETINNINVDEFLYSKTNLADVSNILDKFTLCSTRLVQLTLSEIENYQIDDKEIGKLENCFKEYIEKLDSITLEEIYKERLAVISNLKISKISESINKLVAELNIVEEKIPSSHAKSQILCLNERKTLLENIINSIRNKIEQLV